MALWNVLMVYLMIGVHPYHVSFTDIKYNSKERSLEISVKMLTTDLEETLKKNCACKLDLYGKENKSVKDILGRYLNKHLIIKVDDHPKAIQFEGFEMEEDNTWCYLSVKNVESVRKIDLTQSLLYDYNNQQVSLFHLSANGKEVSDKLEYPESNYSHSF